MIQTLEEHALNAWPALQQLLYDGWLLRFADGYTKRANSVNPMYGGLNQDPLQKIQRCTQIYQMKKLIPLFRLTPQAQPANLDDHLERLGFIKRSSTSVQVLELSTIQIDETLTFRYWPEFAPEWEDEFDRLQGAPANPTAHRAILRSIIPQTCFATLSDCERIVACGLGILEKQFVGLFDIVAAPNHRRQGFGQAMISSILGWARERGATTAYLQVETANTPALNLYKKLGFSEVYQYWYRVKND